MQKKTSRKDRKKSASEKRLTLDQIIKRAVQIADKDGIESLSMRKLASQLNVEAMSLYHHVRSRETLLDHMVDSVFSELSSQGYSKEQSWQKLMFNGSVRMRKVLLSHPWAVGLLDSRQNPGPATLQYQNDRLGKLRSAGFTIEMAAHAVALQDSYIYGFVLQELALPFENGVDIKDQLHDLQGSMPDGQYPFLEEMIREQVLKKNYSFSNEFEFGLKLLIEGLQAKV